MFRLWCILIGYVLGSISVAYIVGKVRGIDIREHGSGNAGTTNTLRVLGRRAGAIVLAGDLLKCFVAMIVCWLIFRNSYPDMKYLIRIYAAAGTILGHDYPFFLKFKGGKGIACFVGMIAFFYPGVIPAEVAIFFGIFLTTHFVSLSSIFLALGFLAQVVIFGQFGFYGLNSTQLLEVYITVGFLVALAIFQHRKNIANLVNGVEKKTYLSKKKAPAEIDLENASKEAEEESFEDDEQSDAIEDLDETDHVEEEITETKETIEESTETVAEDVFDKTIPLPADLDEIIRENESNKGEEK